MKAFITEVDTRSRKAMADYLAGHFRYNTMNSWNNSTSYAHNMKINRLGLDAQIVDRLWELIECEDFYYGINDLIAEFGRDHGYCWQAGFNGRSGGYLVLYQGEQQPSGYKSYCVSCGQKNYKTVEETADRDSSFSGSGNRCGRCNEPARVNYAQTHMQVSIFPGRGTDGEEDFKDWGMNSLRERVKLVQEFDQLAEDILREAVYLAQHYEAVNEKYFVKKTRKVLQEAV